MILRSSYLWMSLIVCLSHAAHLQEEEEIKFLLVCSDISIWFGCLISQLNLWILFLLQF